MLTHVSQHASPSVVIERLTIGAGVVASENIYYTFVILYLF